MATAIATLLSLLLVVPSATGDQDKLNEARSKAEQQLRKGKNDDALKTLEKHAKKHSNSVEAHTALATLCLRLGKLRDAREAAQSAVGLARQAPPSARAHAYATLAGVELAGGPVASALANAEAAVSEEACPESLAILARAQARTRAPESVATAQRAVEMAPEDPRPKTALGEALLAAHRPAEAAVAFREALAAKPSHVSARTGLVAALIATEETSDALVEARRAVGDAPYSGVAHGLLGRALSVNSPTDSSVWSEAIASSQQGQFIASGDPIPAFVSARLYAAAGNQKVAREVWQKAAGSQAGDVSYLLGEARPLPQQPAPPDGCRKEVFGKFCLGGDATGLPPGASQEGDTYSWSGESTVAVAVDGKVARVVRVHTPASWLTFRDLKSRLSSKYGPGVDISTFPGYADDLDSQATSISLGKGRAVHGWQQDGWSIRLLWPSREGILLVYADDALNKILETRGLDDL